MSAPQLRAADAHDAEAIRALLEGGGLPTSDLASEPEFIVACEADSVVATGALRWFGSTALLRSVAVATSRRGAGLGRIIVQELERTAKATGATRLILLTQTAQRFFEHQGYLAIERHQVPQDVQRSEEFRSLCPASAVCMAKTPQKAIKTSAASC